MTTQRLTPQQRQDHVMLRNYKHELDKINDLLDRAGVSRYAQQLYLPITLTNRRVSWLIAERDQLRDQPVSPGPR